MDEEQIGSEVGEDEEADGAVETPAPTPSIPVEVLPEALRGKSEAEIRFTLNNLVEAVTSSNQRTRELEERLREFSQKEPEPTPRPATPAKPLEEWILEDPEAALEHWANQRFGGALNQLKEVENRVGDAEFSSVARELDDFSEFEEDVRSILKESKVPKTRQNIIGAYTLAVGRRAIEERKRGARKGATMETATPEPPKPSEPSYKKDNLSEEIRLAMGMSEKEYYETYAGSQEVEIKVPTGKK